MLKNIACICCFECNYRREPCKLDVFIMEEDVWVLSHNVKSQQKNMLHI